MKHPKKKKPTKVGLDYARPCSKCVHCVTSTGAIPVQNCCLNPVQPQLISFQRSARGVCGPSGQYHKLPKILSLWAKIKALFGVKS